MPLRKVNLTEIFFLFFFQNMDILMETFDSKCSAVIRNERVLFLWVHARFILEHFALTKIY
jgi:hypothetical protein